MPIIGIPNFLNAVKTTVLSSMVTRIRNRQGGLSKKKKKKTVQTVFQKTKANAIITRTCESNGLINLKRFF